MWLDNEWCWVHDWWSKIFWHFSVQMTHSHMNVKLNAIYSGSICFVIVRILVSFCEMSLCSQYVKLYLDSSFGSFCVLLFCIFYHVEISITHVTVLTTPIDHNDFSIICIFLSEIIFILYQHSLIINLRKEATCIWKCVHVWGVTSHPLH